MWYGCSPAESPELKGQAFKAFSESCLCKFCMLDHDYGKKSQSGGFYLKELSDKSQCCFCYNAWLKWLFKNVMQKALDS